MDFVTSHHLKRIDEESTPPEIHDQKDAIFRNINDIGSFHSRYVTGHPLCRLFSSFASLLQMKLSRGIMNAVNLFGLFGYLPGKSAT